MKLGEALYGAQQAAEGGGGAGGRGTQASAPEEERRRRRQCRRCRLRGSKGRQEEVGLNQPRWGRTRCQPSTSQQPAISSMVLVGRGLVIYVRRHARASRGVRRLRIGNSGPWPSATTTTFWGYAEGRANRISKSAFRRLAKGLPPRPQCRRQGRRAKVQGAERGLRGA